MSGHVSDAKTRNTAWLSQLTDGDGPAGAFLAGGMGVALVGAGLGVARSWSRILTSAMYRQMTTTLEVTSKDVAYPWVLNWLNKSRGSLRHVSVNTAKPGGEGSAFELVPGPGRHVVTYRGWPLIVDRAREYGTVATSSGIPWERVTLTTFAAAPSLFEGLLTEARDAAQEGRDETTTTLYTCWGTEWRPFGRPRSRRPLKSVVLSAGVADQLCADIEEWRDSALWYRERGVPYRRGYLLHGPPGGGKTSFVVALAGHFDLDVCLLSLSDEGLTDDRLALALTAVPPRSLVLLEDVDAAFGSRHVGRPETRTPLTLGGLLNALDGAAAAEGRLIFMTTNYADRLDHALLRPGRVDVVQNFDYADADQAARLFSHFYDSGDNCLKFGQTAVRAAIERAERPPSMAELQAFLIARKRDPEAALREAHLVADVALDRVFHERPSQNSSDHVSPRPPAKPRPVKPLTSLDVDRMVFNPQSDWEDMVGKIQGPSRRRDK